MTDEAGWLIEALGGSTSEPRYWTCTGWPDKPSWTKNREDALRFARMTDARTFAEQYLPKVSVRICEHAWAVARGRE